MKTQFILPNDQEEVRIYATGVAFYLAFMEYSREQPKTIKELQERCERAYTLLVTTTQKNRRKLCNDDAQLRLLLEETFFWAYHYCTKMLDGNTSLWKHLIDHIRTSSAEIALSIIFAQLREEWGVISTTLPRTIQKEYCTYEGCCSLATHLVRLVTLKNKQGIPFSFRLVSCMEHQQALKSISHDNGKIQLLLERVVPSFFLSQKILSAKKEKLLIDRFRMAQRWDDTDIEYKMMYQEFGERGVQFALAFIDAYIDIAKKYELTPSAIAFVSCLPPIAYQQALHEAIEYEERVFITFQEPLETPCGRCFGFSFGLKSLENINYAHRIVPHSKAQLAKLKAIMLQEETFSVGLDAFTDSGLAIWTLSFDIPKGANKQPTFYVTQSWQECKSGECGNEKPICSTCMQINEWYYSLYANILRLIQGEYAVEDSQPDYEVKTLSSKRKQPDPEKHWKMREVDVSHTYHIVTMDALLKKERAPLIQEGTLKGSWIDRLDLEKIIYVKKRIRMKQGRTLKHPRFYAYILAHGGDINNGYTISVKDHEKRIPMKLETLMKRIERVEVTTPHV